jgi:hypothetical protein
VRVHRVRLACTWCSSKVTSTDDAAARALQISFAAPGLRLPDPRPRTRVAAPSHFLDRRIHTYIILSAFYAPIYVPFLFFLTDYNSRPTRTNAGSTSNGGLVTTVPPTYISAWRSPPSAGEDRSSVMTRAVHSSCSSARSRSATILDAHQRLRHQKDFLITYLSRRLTDAALLPST